MAYCRLMRLDKPVGTLLLAWGSLWGLWLAAEGSPPAYLLFVMLLGTFLMRSAGCVVNDLADRKFDLHVERTKNRPLTTGELSVSEALFLLCLLFLLSTLLLFFLNWQSALLAIFCALITVVYPFCKRFLPTPQAVLGIAFASAILVAHTAVLGKLTWGAWWLFIANALWALVYDTYYALVDREDDRLLNLKSAAIFATGYELRFIALMMTLMIVCLLCCAYVSGLGAWFLLGVFLALLLMVYQLLACAFFNFDRARCFALFQHNNWVGAAIWLGLVLEFLP